MKKLIMCAALFFGLFSRIERADASAYNVAFIGDSWTAGVGVATTCSQPTMTAATCTGGQSIPDIVASTLGVNAYQNLGLGGALMVDALTNEVENIASNSTMVVVNIGFNDEKPIGDGRDLWIQYQLCDPVTRSKFPNISGNSACGYNEPYTASNYNSIGFSETPNDAYERIALIVQRIKQKAPYARIFLVKPARTDLIPTNSWNATQQLYYQWSDGVIADAIEKQRQNVAGIINLGGTMSYVSGNFVPNGTCPTSGISDCGGHPNSTGAAAIAAIIAAAIQ